jgi:hypothetical protein
MFAYGAQAKSAKCKPNMGMSMRVDLAIFLLKKKEY